MVNPIGDVFSKIGNGILDPIGSGLFGESPQERQDRLLNNEFRDVNQGQFQSGYTPGLMNQAGALGQQLGGFQGPQMGTSSFRGDQNFLLGQLRGDVMGQGPGVELARRQAMQAGGAAGQQQLGMLAGQRGNPLAARTAAQNLGTIGGAAGQQAQTGALQAMLGARGQFGQLAGQARGQDLQRGTVQGQFDLGAQGLRQQGQLAALGQQAQLAQLQQQGLQAYQNARTNRFATIAGMPHAPNTRQQMLGFGVGVAEALSGKPPGNTQ